jgi:Ca2+-transporting ATPase
MSIPPRDPSVALTNKHEVIRWMIYGSTLFLVTLVPLLWGPDTPSAEHATASMTMAFAVMAFGTLLTGLAVRRDPEPAFPVSLKTAGILLIPAVLTVVATQWSALQRLLGTQPLTGEQWLGAVALASIVFIVIEIEKIVRRNRLIRAATPENPIVVLHGDTVAAIDAPARS